MINQDNHAMNSGFDMLHTEMDAGFDMLRANMDAQFASLRAEMSEHFNKVYVLIEELQRETNALLIKLATANTLSMVVLLSIDRWSR